MKIPYRLLLVICVLLSSGCEPAVEESNNSTPAATIPEDGSEPTLTEEGP